MVTNVWCLLTVKSLAIKSSNLNSVLKGWNSGHFVITSRQPNVNQLQHRRLCQNKIDPLRWYNLAKSNLSFYTTFILSQFWSYHTFYFVIIHLTENHISFLIQSMSKPQLNRNTAQHLTWKWLCKPPNLPDHTNSIASFRSTCVYTACFR